MKKRVISLIISIILSFSSIFLPAFAHPGKTDANGGHWDRSTGEYHFHTGEYAGRGSSGSSSSESSYEYFVPPYDPPTENPYKKKNMAADLRRKRLLEEKEKDDTRSRNFITVCACYLAFFCFYLWCSDSSFFKG